MNKFTAILIIVLMAGSFYIGTTTSGSKTIKKVDTTFTIDTVFTPAKIDTQIIHLPVYIETKDTLIRNDTTRVYVSKPDTIYKKDTIFVASADTCFKQGCLEAYYYFPPKNKFQFNWEGKTITKYEKDLWYMDEKLWGAMGFISGILIIK